MTTSPRRVRFPGISSEAYEHPFAQAALSTVRKAKGFDLVLRKVMGAPGEAAMRMHHLACAVKVGDTQFRRLNQVMGEAAHILDVVEPPSLYVNRSIGFNAVTIGFDKPFIVLGSDLIDSMNDDEIRFVVGHELGHAISGHALYESVAWFLAAIGAGGLHGVPGGPLVLKGIELGLQDWGRKSELSGDRAGLLVGQDLEVAIRTLMKLAGGRQTEEMNPSAFLEQAAEFQDATGLRNRIVKWMMPSSDHPLLVVRAAELDRWVRDGAYGRIVHEGDYPLRGESASVKAHLAEGIGGVGRGRASRDSAEGTAGTLLGRLGGAAGGSTRGFFGRPPQ
ncbi:Peptidase family M48 [Streptomyces sp. cf386]|uniref:M48 family metallopeptidase n=1 Tax=Streptomyces sp. cf386 TaxID=1761904 RepID=UPI00088CF291|nr:M48 family metallopeptidase [Streptomyces sp. cf386]SDP74131.1 Peptidase family M48 [Streptomyces sp. cf386]